MRPQKQIGLGFAVLAVSLLFGQLCFSGHFSIVGTSPTSCDFYGTVQVNGSPAQPGDEVAAFDPQGVCCGVFTVNTEGFYGFMAVYGDDSTTPTIDEGAQPGDTITFKIWQASTNQVFDAVLLGPDSPVWVDKGKLNVNLSTSVSQLTLSVTSTYGSPNPGVGIHYYNTGTQVTASVTSPVDAGSGVRYVCTGWTGTGDVPASGTATSVTFTITNNSTITWNWKVQYYLTTQADPVQAGTVTPASNWYDSGSQVQVQATANPSYVFDHWSGDLSGSTNPTVVTVNAPRTVTAVFLGQVNLTVASAYGSPDPGVGSHSYATGTSVTASVFSPVTAGNTRYVCTGWTGTGDVPASGTATSVTFTITQNSTITWNWKVQYLLTTQTNPAAGGSVTPSSNWYDSGESVQVTAVANSGFTFTGWSGDLTGTDNPATVTMNSGKTVMANFSLTGRRYTPVAKTPSVREFYGVITINGVPAQSGDEVGAFDPQGVCCGAFVVEHAGYYGYLPVYGDDSTTPAEDEGAENGDTITFRIWDASEQKEYLAIASVTPLWDPSADPLEVNLSTGASLTVSSAYGSPEPSAGLHIYDTLTQVTASVVSPVAGETGIRYVCTGWTGTGDVPTSGTATSVTFTITNNSTITWNWKTQYLLTIVSAYGTPVGAGWYDAGTTANWSVTSPVAGAEGVRYVAVPSSGSVLMDGPKTITISWITQYYLTLNSTYGTPVGAGWYNEGTSANWSVNSPVAGATGVQYVAIPASGSVFMDGPKTVNITWVTQYYLTIVSAHGSPAGAGWYNAGSTANWSVDSPVAGTTGTRYEARPSSGSVVMNAPNTVTISWTTQYYLSVVSEHGNPQGEGWYDAGTTANWSVTSPWSGGTGIRFVTAPSSGSKVMNEPDTVVISWTTQYYFTVISQHGSPSGEDWYNAGSLVGSAVTTPVTVGSTQYVCTGWTGTGSAPASGTDSSLTFTINEPSAVTWLWKTQYYLKINSEYGNPQGEGWYDAGTTANWSVTTPVSGGTGIRYVTSPASGSLLMNEAKTLNLSWTTQYYLTTGVNNSFGGSVSPESNWYDSGSQVQVQATASSDYTFTGWSGSLSGTTNPVSVTMNGPKEVTANFYHFLPFTQSNYSVRFHGTVKIFTVDAAAGDEIAVYDSSGVCCGSFLVTNTGSYGDLLVYGDDPDTSGVDEGASPGEGLTFRIWKASEKKTYTAKPLGPDNATWTANGDSRQVNLDVGQRIPLKAGWNLFSFSVNRLYYSSQNPPDVATLSGTEAVPVNDIAQALSSIAGKFEVIRSFDKDGYHTYYPDTPQYNTLNYLAPGYGYWIKMKEDVTLELLGAKISPTDTLSVTVDANRRWVLVGCWAPVCYYDTATAPLVTLPEDVTEAIKVDDVGAVLTSLTGQFTYIRSFDADGYHTYKPDTPIFNTLHYFAPGYGYWIKLSENGQLRWSQ